MYLKKFIIFICQNLTLKFVFAKLGFSKLVKTEHRKYDAENIGHYDSVS